MAENTSLCSKISENIEKIRCYICPIIYEFGEYIQMNGVDSLKSKYFIDLSDICIKCYPSEKESIDYFIKIVSESTKPKEEINKIISNTFKDLTQECDEILMKFIETKKILEN